MKTFLPAIVALLAVPTSASADALRTAAVGCTAPADAERIAALLGKRDRAGADALARPLIASRACIEFAKGIKVGVDERRPPLACIRLSGDLSCYWVAAALVDEHPGEKGGGGPKRGGRRR